MKCLHKKFLLLFLTLVMSLSLLAQLEVKEGSFKKVDGFVNLNPNIQSDDNDVLYAVIKIRTENINDKQRHELLFEGNLATFIEVEYKVGEVWVYLSSSPATYLKISQPDMSSTEFWFPFDLEPKQGYELTIVNRFTPVSERNDYNYLIVKADQNNALIYFDDVLIGQQEASKLYKVGENHKWRIDCENYHTEEGESEIILGDPIMIEKVLKPAFGFMNITSEPESGALVFIDGKNVGVTPYNSGKIKSGQHTVKIVKEMYNESEKVITVTDGNTTDVKLTMSAKFVNVTVQTDSESDIYIDNKKVGKGSWTGRLYDGDHVFEAKKASHRTSTKSVKIELGKEEKIVIPNPEPIYGKLDINSTPMGATIILDGKEIGTTPRIVNDVLIGSHELKLEKTSCATLEKAVIVKENEMLSIKETLSEAKHVTISSDTKGDKIYVDGKYVGTSPVSTNIRYGNVTITVESNGKREEKAFVITDKSDDHIHIAIGANVTVNTYQFEGLWNEEANKKDDIFIDGKLTPSKTRLSLGKHKIETKRDGVKRKKTINIKNNNDITLDINTTKRLSFIGVEYYCNTIKYDNTSSGYNGSYSFSGEYANSVRSAGVYYEWNIGQCLVYTFKSDRSGITLGYALKTGVYYRTNTYVQNYDTPINNHNYEKVEYSNFDIPIALKGYIGYNNLDVLWLSVGPMMSFSGAAKQSNNTINGLQGVNGPYLKIDAGVTLYVFTIGYTYVMPLNNQKFFNGDAFTWSGLSIGIKFDSDLILERIKVK